MHAGGAKSAHFGLSRLIGRLRRRATGKRLKDSLLKVDRTGGGMFVTVGALCSRSLMVNAGLVEVTQGTLAGLWRALVSSLQVARIGGYGIFTDELSERAVRDYFSSGVVMEWQVVIPDHGIVEGLFEVSNLESADPKGNKAAFHINLRPAGRLRLTAAKVLVETSKLTGGAKPSPH